MVNTKTRAVVTTKTWRGYKLHPLDVVTTRPRVGSDDSEAPRSVPALRWQVDRRLLLA